MGEHSVTAVIPTYNRAQLTLEAVESVISQTRRADEIIVVDDGSIDEEADRLADRLSGAPGVSLLRIGHCGMPGKVRNAGVARARGDLIAFLDSDDLWRPEKLARQIPLHEGRDRFRISHTRELWIRGGRTVSQNGQRHRRGGDIFEDALVKCIIGPSTVMVDRALFEGAGGFREDIEIAEDYELWLRIVGREEVGYLDDPLTVKRALDAGTAGGEGQLSAKYGQIEIFRIRALQDLVDGTLLPPARMASARAELSRKCRIYAAGCRKRGRREEALRYEAFAARYAD